MVPNTPHRKHPPTFPFIGVSRGGISDPRFFLAVVALVHAAGAVGVFVGFSALGNRRFSAERAEGKLFGNSFPNFLQVLGINILLREKKYLTPREKSAIILTDLSLGCWFAISPVRLSGNRFGRVRFFLFISLIQASK